MTATRLVVPSGGPKMDGISESLLAGGAAGLSRLVDPAAVNYTVCTSSTHPATPAAGALIFETDTGNFSIYSGSAWIEVAGIGAWVAYTPTWSGTLGNGTLTAAYRRHGRTINYWINLLWGTTSSHAASNQSFTLPFAPANGAVSNVPLGSIYSAWDLSGGVVFNGQAISVGTQTTIFFGGGLSYTGATCGVITNAVPYTWATGDQFHVDGTYEATT